MRDQDAVAKTVLAAPQRKSRWRRNLRISLMLVATHALVWGIGRGQGWWTTRAVEEKADHLLKDGQVSKDLLLRFEARRLLGQAQDALDARNFGIAQQQVQLASRLLASSHPSTELSPLSESLAKYQPVVTQDLAGQRQQIATWIGQLDAQLPPLQLPPSVTDR